MNQNKKKINDRALWDFIFKIIYVYLIQNANCVYS